MRVCARRARMTIETNAGAMQDCVVEARFQAALSLKANASESIFNPLTDPASPQLGSNSGLDDDANQVQRGDASRARRAADALDELLRRTAASKDPPPRHAGVVERAGEDEPGLERERERESPRARAYSPRETRARSLARVSGRSELEKLVRRALKTGGGAGGGASPPPSYREGLRHGLVVDERLQRIFAPGDVDVDTHELGKLLDDADCLDEQQGNAMIQEGH